MPRDQAIKNSAVPFSNVPLYRAQRGFDMAVAVPLLAITAVPMAFAAAAVAMTLGRPVIFKQQRLGLNGKPFTIYKFRSMTNKRDADGKLLHETERMTRFGEWMRRHGVDELPQLWNVIKGDMAMVGPRPEPVAYGRGVPNFHWRNCVRPGMTGLAKLKTFHAATPTLPQQKLQFDLDYIAKRGLKRDVAILFKTVAIVFGGRNHPLPMPPTAAHDDMPRELSP